MTNLLWIIAALNLVGGIIMGADMDNVMLGIVIGVVGFALLGGFATVINLLNRIADNIDSIEKKLSDLPEDLKEKLSVISNIEAINSQKNSITDDDNTKKAVDSVETQTAKQESINTGNTKLSTAASWTCINCGRVNNGDVIRCECGARVNQQNSIVKKTVDRPVVVDQIKNTWICGRCGRENDSNVIRCQCGARFDLKKASDKAGKDPDVQINKEQETWTCSKCGRVNNRSVIRCQCGERYDMNISVE